MKIRIFNESDWEKTYEFDKSIIRIGSQVSCDIQLRDANIQPLMMQIVRIGGADDSYNIRFFADNIMLIRGNQNFMTDQISPYNLLDGDKITFSHYRLIFSVENEKKRIRTSPHMKAEMFLSKRELLLGSPINGMVLLTNLGTEKPCQFRMQISGIPADCLHSAPLPYLYPGTSSTVAFIISHLQTRPSPGFHTVSLTLSAENEYFGELLEFNQDIYVEPIFNTDMVLDDDSNRLSGFNSEQQEAEKRRIEEKNKVSVPIIPDTRRMNVDEVIEEQQKPENSSIRVVGSDDSALSDVFEEPEEEVSAPYSRRKKKEEVVVIRHSEDDDVFDDTDGSKAKSDSTDGSGDSEIYRKKKKAVRKKKKGKEEKPALTEDEPANELVLGRKRSSEKDVSMPNVSEEPEVTVSKESAAQTESEELSEPVDTIPEISAEQETPAEEPSENSISKSEPEESNEQNPEPVEMNDKAWRKSEIPDEEPFEDSFTESEPEESNEQSSEPVEMNDRALRKSEIPDEEPSEDSFTKSEPEEINKQNPEPVETTSKHRKKSKKAVSELSETPAAESETEPVAEHNSEPVDNLPEVPSAQESPAEESSESPVESDFVSVLDPEPVEKRWKIRKKQDLFDFEAIVKPEPMTKTDSLEENAENTPEQESQAEEPSEQPGPGTVPSEEQIQEPVEAEAPPSAESAELSDPESEINTVENEKPEPVSEKDPDAAENRNDSADEKTERSVSKSKQVGKSDPVDPVKPEDIASDQSSNGSEPQTEPAQPETPGVAESPKNKKGPSVPVFSSAGGFDDTVFDDDTNDMSAEFSNSGNTAEEPQVRVMKGGDFDE